jgi:hypothetical protein
VGAAKPKDRPPELTPNATWWRWFNLTAAFYSIGRRLFLKDTGQKLAHIEKQLRTDDTISEELSHRLKE